MTSSKPRGRDVAYHEAGHAVMAYVLHCKVPCSVEIRDDGTGQCTFGQLDVPEHIAGLRAYMEATVITLLAGSIAQARATKRGVLEAYLSSGRGDPTLARECIDDGVALFMGGFDRYEKHARLLVKEHWVVIDRVAQALLHARRLDTVALTAIFGGAS